MSALLVEQSAVDGQSTSETTESKIVVPWPDHRGHKEIQCDVCMWIRDEFKGIGLETRLEVSYVGYELYTSGTLDIVIYLNRIAIAIIEVKPKNQGWSYQIVNYRRIGLPMFLFNEQSSYDELRIFINGALAGKLRPATYRSLVKVALKRLERCELKDRWVDHRELTLAAKIGFCGEDAVAEAFAILEGEQRLKRGLQKSHHGRGRAKQLFFFASAPLTRKAFNALKPEVAVVGARASGER
jgi:hypothetical protein